MSRFAPMAHELAALMPAPKFSADDLIQMDVGRQIALEITDEIRRGTREPDLLMLATILAGRSNEHVLRGFYRGVQEALA